MDLFDCLGRPPENALPAADACLGVHIGKLVGLSASGALVSIGQEHELASARSTVELGEADIDRELVLVFENGDRRRPIILGCLQALGRASAGTLRVEADGERVVLSASEQVVLQCGESSITLTRSGKVLIRGHYIQSRATGLNAVKGGTIELN